jgi:hypothetical protein
MWWLSTLFLTFALVGLAGFVVMRERRTSGARHQLAVDLHDKALGLDQRCDYLQAHLYLLEERQRIDHIFYMVADGESTGRLTPEVARHLRSFVLELRSESFVAQDEKALAA